MSLNQKYTWHDFLKEHPEHKEKKTKRTSSEGKKAFEAAFKAHVKKYLTADLPKKLEALESRIGKRRTAENTTVRELRKAKKFAKATIAQRRLGRSDRALAGIKKQKTRAQAAAKNF